MKEVVMTGATIEILPKTRFEHSSGSLTFKASTPQAVDTSGFNFLSLQVWVYNLQGGRGAGRAQA